MVVRGRAGRRRYISFAIEGNLPVGRGPLLRALTEALAPLGTPPQLLAFDGARGIVRVPHQHASAARPLLEGLASIGGRMVRLRTLRTSGTVRKLRRHVAKEPRRARPARQASYPPARS